MSGFPRHRWPFAAAVFLFLVHLGVAYFARPSFELKMFGDAMPCLLLILALLSLRLNLRYASTRLPLFWNLVTAGLVTMLVSNAYWMYYDFVVRFYSPSPIFGNALFLLAHVFFLSALALRPHASNAGNALRFRGLDFVLLSLWWLTLYVYFAVPWQTIVPESLTYGHAFYLLIFVQHLVIITALSIVCLRYPGPWRRLYAHLLFTFIIFAVGSFILSIGISRRRYFPGSFYVSPTLLALVWFSYVPWHSSSLPPVVDSTPHLELIRNLWTARYAMLATLSLPVIAILGFTESNSPPSIVSFRLRMVFCAMFLIGALVFWKLNLLTRELDQFVRLTSASIANLKSVQGQVTHSEKLAALGRLAAGAAHEISNPLTAILGYSELLSDIPSLSPQDRENAEGIRRQVHQAQAAVNSLRNTLRRNAGPAPSLDKSSSS